ncbi:aspartyl protease family protein [Flavobacterium sp.]|uniref:aspartyl protease family protein n=1 Tax=Flavobacterium sp. TaxID=239 RepID=UPI00261819A7|nr:aspartyl protease family protein [Flavobacterium sp.]
MKCRLTFLFLVLLVLDVCAQEGFQLPEHRKKIVIPFTFFQNLIIIPVVLNGTPMNFMLDTGVEHTLLFSLEDTDNVRLNQMEAVKVRGLGNLDAIDAYSSENNRLEIGPMTDLTHKLYLILDERVNISTSVGMPINGIIGYHFFKSYSVRIDYIKQKITLSKEVSKLMKRREPFAEIPLTFIQNKPYLQAMTALGSKVTPAFYLLDTGNTDVAWLFPNSQPAFIFQPYPFVDDYLGRGLSGDIYGKRGRIDSIALGPFSVKRPLVAFPKGEFIQHLLQINGRNGSLGNELLKRFHLVWDYSNQKIYVRPNAKINEPFLYNMSGLEIVHSGLEWVTETKDLTTQSIYAKNVFSNSGQRINDQIKVLFVLRPTYVVELVRVNSPSDQAGLRKGDQLYKINDYPCTSLTLDQINGFLKMRDGKTVEIEYIRNGKILRTTLILKDLLP